MGFDLFFTSGVTRGLPAMVPVAMLYDTPDNAAAEIAYLKARGYPVSYVEMGERRQPVSVARRLCCTLPAMGNGNSSRRPGAEAGRAVVSGSEQGH